MNEAHEYPCDDFMCVSCHAIAHDATHPFATNDGGAA